MVVKAEEGRCEGEVEVVEGGGGFSAGGRVMLGESGTGRLGGKAAALGTGRHRRRLRCRGGRGREGRKEEVVVLERKAGGGGGMPAEGGSIGVHRHPAREAWGSPEKIGRGGSSSSSRACFRVSGQTCVYHRYSPLSAQR
jgi:hypothetical protein